MQTHYRACNLCEAICGLEIKVENGKVISIAGDKNDPLSRGHICPKAVALKDIYEDPNRLKFPMKRTADGWQQISWEQAFDEVILKLKNIQATYGNNAVGVYQGNPSIHNSGTFMTAPLFVKALKTKNVFSATSADQLPHHFTAWQLFGHPMLLPIPDIDNTDFMLIIGGNPIASNGSMMTVPDVEHRLKAIQKRGGKIVVIDPRFTETAAKADKHFFIKPNNDIFLLLAMINVLFAKNLVKLGKNTDFIDNLAIIEEITKAYTPTQVSKLIGISVEEIEQLTIDFASAESAVCYGRVGVSTQAFGTLSLWLINVINIITGNLDKQGGVMFTTPAIDFLARAKPNENRFNRWQSRVRNLPEFSGELPVATLAKEILTEGNNQIKAMITSCGNPVLSTPNGTQLDEAFASLEFMVAFDIYINETTRHAHYILPPATGLEVAHYDMTFLALAIRNIARYSEPLFEKTAGAKYDWEIFEELRQRMNNEEIKPINPEIKIDMGLQVGTYNLTLQKLKDNPHGIDLGEMKPCLPNRLLTENKRINLAPEILLKDMERLQKVFKNTETTNEFNLLLIGRRHLRDNNSWMHNSHRLVKGNNRCTLMIHSKDAKRLSLENHSTVQLSSRVSKIAIPIEITDNMMEGVVCMPHGYGHHRAGIQLDIAQQHAGVSINDLTDELYVDDLTGTVAFNGVAVRIDILN